MYEHTKMRRININPEVNAAVKRLDSIFPPVAGLKSLSSEDAALYCKLPHSYVQQSRTLTRDEVVKNLLAKWTSL